MFDVAAFLDKYATWLPLMIFFARIVDVSMGTVRTICLVRGFRFIAAALGFVEILIWIVAVSSVVTQVHHPLNMVAYAAGFATGNWVGITLERRIALGEQTVRLMSHDRGHSIAYALRLSGDQVIELVGRTRHGPATISFVTVPRREVNEVIRIAREVDPSVFISTEDVRGSSLNAYRRVPEKTGWRTLFKKK
jgi:uncharacterized protein YebE (UPF0316 family)